MNFDETKQYVKTVKKLDGHKFDRVTDFTNMIDLLNEDVENRKTAHGDNEIHEISKYLADSIGRKMFVVKSK